MQIQFIGRWIRGFKRVTDYAQSFLAMSVEAARRLKVLKFWNEHGLLATVDAFEVSRRTLYRWRRELALQGNNSAALDPRPKAPKHRRKRNWPAELVEGFAVYGWLTPTLAKRSCIYCLRLSVIHKVLHSLLAGLLAD